MYHYRNESKFSVARSARLPGDNGIDFLVEDHQGDNGAQDESQWRAQLLAVIGVD